MIEYDAMFIRQDFTCKHIIARCNLKSNTGP